MKQDDDESFLMKAFTLLLSALFWIWFAYAYSTVINQAHDETLNGFCVNPNRGVLYVELFSFRVELFSYPPELIESLCDRNLQPIEFKKGFYFPFFHHEYMLNLFYWIPIALTRW